MNLKYGMASHFGLYQVAGILQSVKVDVVVLAAAKSQLAWNV